MRFFQSLNFLILGKNKFRGQCRCGVCQIFSNVLGGYLATKEYWVYHCHCNNWELLAPMKGNKAFCQVALMNDNIYITREQSRKPLASVEIFN